MFQVKKRVSLGEAWAYWRDREKAEWQAPHSGGGGTWQKDVKGGQGLARPPADVRILVLTPGASGFGLPSHFAPHL